MILSNDIVGLCCQMILSNDIVGWYCQIVLSDAAGRLRSLSFTAPPVPPADKLKIFDKLVQ